MTKRNLIIVIILLAVIDLVAAGWYMSRRIETGNKGESIFGGRDSSDVIVEADTVVNATEPDEFDDLQQTTFYHVANSPAVSGDKSTCYTSIKHVKVRWPKTVNGSDKLESLNKELISKAFGNSQSKMKEGRYMYLNTPSFNKPMGDDYHSQTTAPAIVPVYGNVRQVLVYPYMTSQRLLVMEIDKVEYNGHVTAQDSYFIHYDRIRHRVLSRIDMLGASIDNENKLLKLINKKIDILNRGRSDSNRLQHALNVPAELCCGKKGVLFQFRQGSISSAPIEVEVDYDDLKPYLTAGFAQLLDNNSDYQVFKEKINPEPINVSRQVTPSATVNVPVSEQMKSTASQAYSNGYNHKKSRHNGYSRKRGNYYRNGNSYRKDRNSGNSGYDNGSSSGYRHQSAKQGYRSQKRYSGATRKAGRYGHAEKRRWSHRRR